MGLPRAGVELIAEGLAQFLSGMGKADDAVDKFGKSGGSAGKSFSSGFGEVVTGAMRQVGASLVDFGVQATKAVAGFVKDSVAVAGDFEAGMHKFQAVAGKGVDTKGLQQFHDLFISLGKELPVSTSEVEQAAIEMVSGGIDPAIVAGGALKQTLQFAAASGLSLADAAATSAKFLAGWTSSAATAEEKVKFLALSTDTLTKAAAASSTTAAELRLGLFNVQGAAQALHASFEDTTASLALLAPAFESSAQAGTALNVFMTRLVPQTNPAKDAMNELGLMTTSTTKLMDYMRKQGIQPLGTDLDTLGNQFTAWASSQGMTEKEITKIWKSFDQSAFFDAQGNFAGMANAAQLLKDKLGGLTDEQKINYLHTLFGNDAMKVANLLMQDGAAGLEGMKAKMNEANGVQDTAALMLSGYNTALENAKGSVEALQITLGEKLLPVLTDLLNNTIAPAINAFTDWASSILSADDPIQELVNQIDTFSPVLGTVVAAIADFVTSGGDLGVVADDLNDGMSGLGDAFMVIAGVTGAVVGGVQAVAKAFQGSGDSMGALQKTAMDVFGTLQTYIPAVLATIRDVTDAVLKQVTVFWAANGKDITAFVRETWTTISDIINTLLKLDLSIIIGTLKTAADFIDQHGAQIQQIFKGAWELISGTIQTALALIQGIIHVALDIINGDWSKAWTDIQAMVSGVAQGLNRIVSGLFDTLGLLFSTSSDKLLATWNYIWNTAVEIAEKIPDRMIAIGGNIIDGIVEGVSDGVGRLTSAVEHAAQAALDAAKNALGIHSPSTEFFSLGEWSGKGYLLGFESMLPQIMQSLDDFGSSVTGKVQSIADGIQKAIASGFSSEANIDRQLAKNLDAVAAITDTAARASVEKQLKDASVIAGAMTDPAQAAKFFKMRSDQIFELAKLQAQIDKETDADKRARLVEQLILVSNAQRAEQSAMDAAKSDSPTDMLWKQYNDLRALLDKIESNPKDPFHAALAALGDPLIGLYNLLIQLSGAAGRAAGGSVTSGKPYWVGEHGQPELFVPRSSGMVMPPASPGQIMQGGNTSYSQSTTLNMPIYTNMSPSAIGSSLAIAGAALP